MNQIKTRTLSGELKCEDTVVLTYKISYPEIISLNYFGKDIFNINNKEKALNIEKYVKDTLYNEACRSFKANKDKNPIIKFELISDYKITYNQGYILSLYIDQYEFTGGAHGSTIRSSQTWDLRFGRKLSLAHFYPNDTSYLIDLLKNINNQIATQISQGYGYFDNYCQLILETFNPENFYLTPSGIAIFFQQYDIAPYSSGIPVFII